MIQYTKQNDTDREISSPENINRKNQGKSNQGKNSHIGIAELSKLVSRFIVLRFRDIIELNIRKLPLSDCLKLPPHG
ncbi:hypothetical protein NQ317_017778 [Molorchus minor]|uniref:Uncharacterized protein n=1 Tax=Molorchus minor TaxID=1323400 RepID=A0ABQ9K3H3_9CUCU|nr:hypothetical protein NQ317_017778 [Molorchus minor]